MKMTNILMFLIMLTLLMMISSKNKFNPMIILTILFNLNLICVYFISLTYDSHLYSFIFFLMMIGGMLIMFMYMNSFINYKKMNNFFNWMIKMNLKIILIILMFKFLTNSKIWMNMNLETIPLNFSTLFWKNSCKFKQIIYSYPSNKLILLTIFYLLYLMITVMYLCKYKNSSMRKINF
uniref:NADH dehydrogenase subunit 6 n=1 Tax=Helorus sp. ZJUH_2016017 TaxID=2491159 RepID=A0A3S8V0T0_9HYME|nr:NADH dehydrogenase subunit 6 [Helorus sp. ZJUH_2016017]